MNSSEQKTPRHLLVIIDHQGKRTYNLQASMYSIGRDESNAIVLKSDKISRQHAMLIRMPLPDGKGYRYKIQDGNLEGKKSVNGITVNGKQVDSAELKNGDMIVFGGVAQAAYYLKNLTDRELADYSKQPEYKSLKGKITDPEKTVAMLDDD
ncbi:MAG: FHA domain-containing protein [Pseudanabaenaceae cyanobacterium SKYGB_i_bin29]|nr:FHA domain-containing protein [Pseudanabaenaceae cyanobacterium SKYG29]MDW8421750.1 FHA domain-containing protein [Pseudanabaenaceae cyanobacterium SKYGB_i_bin29]